MKTFNLTEFKKLILLTVTFFIISNTAVYADGKFELVDFSEVITITAGEAFSRNINFYYSGPQSDLGVSVVGRGLPTGLKLGPVEYGINGVNSIKLFGVPNEIGIYPLQLLLTDNHGIILTQKFTVAITGLVFTENNLPDGLAGKAYSVDLKYSYAGTRRVSLQLFPGQAVSGYDGIFHIELPATQAGTYTYTGTVFSETGLILAKQTFYLNVKDLAQQKVENNTTVISENLVASSTKTKIQQLPQSLNKGYKNQVTIENPEKKSEAAKPEAKEQNTSSSTIVGISPDTTELSLGDLFRMFLKKLKFW